MSGILKSVKSRLVSVISRLTFSPIKYWEKRAQAHGELSVLNLSHSKAELEKVKELQIKTLFPYLKAQLTGNEKTLLDFGCGPGRFTPELATLIGGQAIGADPIGYLLQLAPPAPDVSYKKIEDAIIPSPDQSFDVIWICLVLGGIVSARQLKRTIKEINRVSKEDTLLFLVENTTEQKDIMTWRYRSVEAYSHLFRNFNLKHLGDYSDVDERIAILAGRNAAYQK